MTERNDTSKISRRTLLRGTAATGALAGFAGTGAAEVREILEGVDVESAIQDSDAARNFMFVGIVGGWIGVGPAEIDTLSNPTLRLVEGEEHEIFWVNGDGNHHNFNLQNEDGEVILSTELVTEQGATQRVSFTPESGLSDYFCAPHPVQMRGQVELIDSLDAHELRVDVRAEDGESLFANVAVDGPGADGSLDERFGPYVGFSDVLARGQASEDRGISRFDTLEDGTYTVSAWTYGYEQTSEVVTVDGSDEQVTLTLSEIEPGEPSQVYQLTLQDGGWRGEAPERIAGETNPTLTVTPGETYRVEWTNQASLDYPDQDDSHGFDLPGHNFVVARENGSTIKRSDFLTEQGETQTVDFVAEDELGTYLDQAQLDARGEIEADRDVDPDDVDVTVRVDSDETETTTESED